MNDDTNDPLSPDPDSDSDITRLLGDIGGTAEEISALLVDSFPPVQPDDSVWGGIDEHVRSSASREDVAVRTPVDTSDAARGRPSYAKRFSAVLAAAAVLIAIVGTLVAVDRSSDDGVVLAAAGVVRQLADPASGDAFLTVVTSEDGLSVAAATQLPTLDATQTYQLWSVVDDQVVSVGLLGPDPADASFRIEGNPTVLALTVEVAGGVAVSEATPVAVWQSS